jgi:hypothetical protein
MAADVFPALHDRERIHSVLADLAKTAAEFREVANKAIDHLASGALLQLRSATHSRLGFPCWRPAVLPIYPDMENTSCRQMMSVA